MPAYSLVRACMLDSKGVGWHHAPGWFHLKCIMNCFEEKIWSLNCLCVVVCFHWLHWSFKMAAIELGYLLTKSPFWLSLWHDISISWHGGKEMFCQQCHPSVASGDANIRPRNAFRIHTCVVILSIFPIWRIRETNPSTKTSKILFSIVMPTFGKSCRRPWLHSLKNQG